MADVWDQFPDAPEDDPWARFPDATPEAAPKAARPVAAAAPPRSFGERALDFYKGGSQFNADVRRAAVAGVRDLGQGAANFMALPGNLGTMAYNAISGDNVQTPSQALSLALDEAGAPRTQNPYIRGINEALGGTVFGLGGGAVAQLASRPVAQRVGTVLQASPGQQIAGGVMGTTASQGAADLGFGPVVQTLAGIGGGAGAGLLRSGTVDSLKRSFRGGETGRLTMQDNIATFDGATGRTPSVGQATQNRRMQATESMLSRAPGGAGVLAREGEALADDLSAGIERQAGRLSAKASPEKTGRVISESISGENGFVENFKRTQGALYDKVDQFVRPDTRVNITNTRQALSELNAEIANAPELSKWFQNSRIKGIQAALDADTALPPTQQTVVENMVQRTVDVPTPPRDWMPYESIKKLRTLVGNEMADAGLMSDVPRSKWKALYAALSRDMEAAVKEAGPQAENNWRRANNYTRAGMSRLDSMAHVIDKAGGPEKVFAAAISGTSDGATTLRAVMQSLPEDGRKAVSATVLRRLGRATAGKQDDAGEVFSTETFLTNWNKMSPEAKATLFNRYDKTVPSFRADMDKIAKVAANLRSGSRVFVNPSGTAQAGIQYSTVGGFVVALATGNFGTAGAIAGGVGAANLSARLLTHPPFVKWLAANTQKPIGALPSAINQLAQSKDPLMQEAAAALAKQQGQQPNN